MTSEERNISAAEEAVVVPAAAAAAAGKMLFHLLHRGDENGMVGTPDGLDGGMMLLEWRPRLAAGDWYWTCCAVAAGKALEAISRRDRWLQSQSAGDQNLRESMTVSK